ncbi:MAG: YggS family pyridoxal phosphate-dependent enzyme [Bdellovibrionota bacterium]
MLSSVQIAANLSSIRGRIDRAAERAGREPSSVRLVAVTKTLDSAVVRSAISAGHRLFGENYVQEAKAKTAALDAPPDCEFHLIGALQRNKAKDAVGMFHVIQTVDRPELADKIAECAARKNIEQRVLVQVNISQEETKGGIDAGQTLALVRHVLSLRNVKLLGIMCIGTYFETTEPDELRRSELRAMRRLQVDLQQATGAALPELSMGMSHDFELAVEEGATLVRVGTALFGSRPPKV